MNYSKIIDEFKQSKMYEWYKYGEDYYNTNNTTITERRMSCYVDGMGVVNNPFKANHKLPSGYFSMVVDQATNYLLGNGIVFEDETFEKDKYNEDFDDFANGLVENAQKKGVAWAYFYLDNGQLKVTEKPAECVIPIYSDGKLVEVIYLYMDKGKEYYDVYTSESVTTYQGKNLIGQKGHYMTQKTVSGVAIEETQNSFGMIPFVPLWYAKNKQSALHPIKALIDIYDITNSDFANNIDDMQEAFLILKNYSGEGIGEFLAQLKAHKAIPVDEHGDVTSVQQTIPTEARSVFLKLTDENIYKFAMAVNPNAVAGGSLTNVVIRAQYANLDLKCDKMEMQIRRFVRGLLAFIGAYEGKEYETGITLERSLIINVEEKLKTNKEMVGVVSEKTRLKNHPWVDDVEEEMKNLEEESNGDVEDIDNNLGF